MKNTATTLRITPYERRHRQMAHDLLFFSRLQHTHLDWHDLNDWLDEYHTFVRLAWQGEALVGLMATSQPLNNVCWIRLVALHESDRDVLPAMWGVMAENLRGLDTQTIFLLATQDWILPYIKPLGFAYDEHIVTMFRNAHRTTKTDTEGLQIRPVSKDDVRQLIVIDNSAFPPPWQLTINELRQAIRIATICTIAEMDNRLVGYQLCTHYQSSAHLARLAVLPAMQSRGIGAALLQDVLQRFEHRGVDTMSVNTQMSNERSQRLYYRFGFRRNGYDLPVWHINL